MRVRSFKEKPTLFSNKQNIKSDKKVKKKFTSIIIKLKNPIVIKYTVLKHFYA